VWWIVGAAANLVVAVAYLAIAYAITAPLVRQRRLSQNRLGVATAAILFTSAVHYGGAALRAVLPVFYFGNQHGFDMAAAFGTQQSFDTEAIVWDIVTAIVGVYYLTLRRTYGSLLKGAKLFDDLKERRRRALEINDNIVQGLTVAQLALALDDRDSSKAALEGTLAAARKIITDLMGEEGSEQRLGPGDLRRSSPASVRKN
jgi:signal transduction histidine kinase